MKKSPDFSVPKTFDEFYPLYLREHSNLVNRRLHFLGSNLTILCLIAFVLTGTFAFAVLPLIVSYGFPWFGHFCFEKNIPATFSRPLWSIRGEWRMYHQIVIGELQI